MLEEVKIRMECERLDEATKKVNQLIELLKKAKQEADSLKVNEDQ